MCVHINEAKAINRYNLQSKQRKPKTKYKLYLYIIDTSSDIMHNHVTCIYNWWVLSKKVYLWNWWRYAGGSTVPPGKCGYRNAARLAVSNGLRKLKPKWLNGFGGNDDPTTVADGIGPPPLGRYGLYGWPDGPTFSCFRHFARRFWNHTCKERKKKTYNLPYYV